MIQPRNDISLLLKKYSFLFKTMIQSWIVMNIASSFYKNKY